MQEHVLLLNEQLSEHISNEAHDVTDNNVDVDSKENDHCTHNDCEEHLVLLSLLNTLFPHIELEGSLLTSTTVTKCLDVDEESLIETLQAGDVHAEESLEGGTQVEGRLVHRVLTLIDQIEYLNDDWMFEETLHIHFKHDIK